MKKLMLIVAFAGVTSFAFAQKPSSGSITTEIGMTSLIGTPATPASPNGIAQGMLRARYFLNEGMALRVGLGLGMGSTTTNAGTEETVVKTTGFGIGVGVEKHLSGTSKLSPYVGGELSYGIASGSTEITNLLGTAGDKKSISGGGTSNLGVSALIGADYWLVERVYIGAELGVGLFSSSNVADTDTETTVGGGATVKVTTVGSKSSNFGINPAALGQVRIGLLF